jgi:Ca-activated chloride channel homolog
MYRTPLKSLRRFTFPVVAFRIAIAFAISGACLAPVRAEEKGRPQPRYQDNDRVSVVPRNGVQSRSRTEEAYAHVKISVDVVLIPVTVTDSFGKPLPGLRSEAFKVFEDGVEQRVTYFSNEDAPVSVGVLFDASGSMESKVADARNAVKELFKASMEGDEYFLVAFNDYPKLLCGFTRDPEEMQSSLLFIQPKGWTSLLDAVYFGVNKMKRARNSRRALIILSDGGDNNSRYSESEIRGLVRESDVTLYAAGMVGWGISKHSARLLTELSEETGGKYFPVSKPAELPDAVEKISAVMRDQYVLGYSPIDPRRDGRYRKVQVRLAPAPDMAPVRATWRVGYYSPAQFD